MSPALDLDLWTTKGQSSSATLTLSLTLFVGSLRTFSVHFFQIDSELMELFC